VRETPRLHGYDETPVYTMKTVVQQTGITPTTLRAWERRYGILQPDRTDGGYRLYSEQDIALLRWLKGQVEAGVNIGRAVALLEMKRHDGADPISNRHSGATGLQFKSTSEPEVDVPLTNMRTTDTIFQELLDVLLHFCETRAGTIFSEAFALYPVEVVTENIIVPALVEVGERWQQNAISVVQANFVTSFLRQKVTSLFTAYTQPAVGPLAVTGSAPGEWHDIGILLVSLALRRRGWRVLYLGPNVPVAQLVGELPDLKPELVCLSATTVDNAYHLLTAAEILSRMPEPRPRFAFGGRAFSLRPELREQFPDAFPGNTASEFVAALVQST
jgi:MerR family transcriptional regulator, light-induced transcriptional regulator